MKRLTKYTFLWIALFLLLPVAAEKTTASAKTTITVTYKEKAKKYTASTATKVTLDQKKLTTRQLPPVQIGSTWMVSAREVFQKGLGCEYTVDGSTLTLRNPVTDDTLTLTRDSRKAVLDQELTHTLSYAVVSATNKAEDAQDFYVPVIQTARYLGYACRYSSSAKKIQIKTLTLFYEEYAEKSFNKSGYSNAVVGAQFYRNSGDNRGVLTIDTLYTLNDDQVKIDESEKNGTVTYTFINTYNGVGTLQKTLSQTALVKKISITSEGSNTVVTVSYNTKYTYMTVKSENGIDASFSSDEYSLKVPLPKNVKFSGISTQDCYYNHYFKITIPGNQETFYAKNEIIQNNNQIDDLDVSASSGKTTIRVDTKSLQGYKLVEKDGYFLVMMDTPRKIYKHIVILDAGHGGKDNGASSRGTKEKNLNYKIIYTLASKYFNAQDSTVKAYWTRTTDTFITLDDRARFASKMGADMFVSLHMNSSPGSSANGMEVYYSKDNNKSAYSGLTSKTLARRMNSQIKNDLDASSRGVKTAGFYVIKHNTVPAILLELGFLSGSRDYANLVSSSYQNRAAKSIYDCVSGVFKDYPTKR